MSKINGLERTPVTSTTSNDSAEASKSKSDKKSSVKIEDFNVIRTIGKSKYEYFSN